MSQLNLILAIPYSSDFQRKTSSAYFQPPNHNYHQQLMMTGTPSILAESRKRRRSMDEDGNHAYSIVEEEAQQKRRIEDHFAEGTPTHKYSHIASDLQFAVLEAEDEQARKSLELDALNRWDHPLQRGTAGGRREMVVAKKTCVLEAGKPVPPPHIAAWDIDDWAHRYFPFAGSEYRSDWTSQYEGPATIWGTLDRRGQLVVRAWPDGWENPVPLSDKTRVGLTWTTNMAALTASTKRADAIARAFENAERSIDPARSITVDEARLIKTYASSYRAGLRFIKHAEWLEFHPEEPDRWQAECQVRGKVVWKRLQDAYGARNLPSKDTLAIAAVLVFQEHFKAAGISELRWLNESYYDAMLILVHTRIWRTSGTALQKNSIHDFPLSHNERPLVIVDEDGQEKHGVKELLDEWKFLCNKRVVTKSTDLADLSHASPIAAAALGSRLRHHKDETGIPVSWA